MDSVPPLTKVYSIVNQHERQNWLALVDDLIMVAIVMEQCKGFGKAVDL